MDADTITPEMIFKARGRLIVQQELGQLRTFASQVAHINPSVKEEELFLSLATAWLDGLTRETSTIFGPENTCRLLDIFNNGKSE